VFAQQRCHTIGFALVRVRLATGPERLKRLLAEAELEKDALREVAKDAPIDVKC